MKHFSKLLVSAFAAFSMVACSEDLPEGGNNNFYPGSEDDKAYIQVDVKLPSALGSRSNTVEGGDGSQSNTGVEVGKDYENNVHTILLVLATPEGKYVSHGVVGGLSTNDNNNPSTAVKSNVTATASISRTDLNYLYENGALMQEYQEGINVYVFCNPLQALVDVLNKAQQGDVNWINESYEIRMMKIAPFGLRTHSLCRATMLQYVSSLFSSRLGINTTLRSRPSSSVKITAVASTTLLEPIRTMEQIMSMLSVLLPVSTSRMEVNLATTPMTLAKPRPIRK